MRKSEMSPEMRQIIEEAEEKLNASSGPWRVEARLLTPDILLEEKLRDIICEVFHVKWSWVFSKSRKRELVDARHAYLYFGHLFLGFHSKSIGVKVDIHDHSTVLSAVNKIKDLISCNDPIKHKIEEVRQKLFA